MTGYRYSLCQALQCTELFAEIGFRQQKKKKKEQKRKLFSLEHQAPLNTLITKQTFTKTEKQWFMRGGGKPANKQTNHYILPARSKGAGTFPG